jgi:hypothetical protein
VLGLTVFSLAGFGAVLLLWYGAYGLSVDDVFFTAPWRRGAHFHGILAWFIVGFYYCIAAALISFIVRFGFDPSPKRPFYKRFYRCLKYVIYGLCAGYFIILFFLIIHKK